MLLLQRCTSSMVVLLLLLQWVPITLNILMLLQLLLLQRLRCILLLQPFLWLRLLLLSCCSWCNVDRPPAKRGRLQDVAQTPRDTCASCQHQWHQQCGRRCDDDWRRAPADHAQHAAFPADSSTRTSASAAACCDNESGVLRQKPSSRRCVVSGIGLAGRSSDSGVSAATC